MSKDFCLKPCKECPFKIKSLPGFLGGFDPSETQQAASSEDDFDCHLTREDGKERKHCAGRMLFAKNNAKMFRRKDLEEIKNTVVAANPNYKKQILHFTTFNKHHTS